MQTFAGAKICKSDVLLLQHLEVVLQVFPGFLHRPEITNRSPTSCSLTAYILVRDFIKTDKGEGVQIKVGERGESK